MDFSRKPRRFSCLHLVCSCRYSHSQLRMRKQQVVAQGHCLHYTPCLVQLNVSWAWVLTASSSDPGRQRHSTLPPTWKHEKPENSHSPAAPGSRREFQVNHMWVRYSEIAKYDKMEVLASNTACHGLSCCWNWCINKDVFKQPSLQFTHFLKHLNLASPELTLTRSCSTSYCNCCGHGFKMMLFGL